MSTTITKKKFSDVKAVEVVAKEWFDRTYGNSYFSAQVHITYKNKDTETLYIPFRYGYDDCYRWDASKAIEKHFGINSNETKVLFRYAREFDFYLSNHKYSNCLKRDVVAFGKE